MFFLSVFNRIGTLSESKVARRISRFPEHLLATQITFAGVGVLKRELRDRDVVHRVTVFTFVGAFVLRMYSHQLLSTKRVEILSDHENAEFKFNFVWMPSGRVVDQGEWVSHEDA